MKAAPSRDVSSATDEGGLLALVRIPTVRMIETNLTPALMMGQRTSTGRLGDGPQMRR